MKSSEKFHAPDPEISVVILCYGAGDRAYGFVEKTRRLLDTFIPSWEIILVGNYFDEHDETARVVRDIASRDPRIKAVAKQKKGMMGWDARSGMEKAGGRFICLIDGDEQMPYRDIVRVYRKITKEGLDLTKTQRAIRHDGLIRITISFFYNTIFNLLFPGINGWDINSKPKIMRRSAYRRLCLTSDDWFLDAQIMIQARRLHLKTGTILSKFYKCNYRNSFVKFSTIFEFIRNLFQARISEFRPVKK